MMMRSNADIIIGIDPDVKRLLYQDSEAFQEGVKVGKTETIEKACEWLKFNTNWDDEWDDMGKNMNYGMIEEFRKAMEE